MSAAPCPTRAALAGGHDLEAQVAAAQATFATLPRGSIARERQTLLLHILATRRDAKRQEENSQGAEAALEQRMASALRGALAEPGRLATLPLHPLAIATGRL